MTHLFPSTALLSADFGGRVAAGVGGFGTGVACSLDGNEAEAAAIGGSKVVAEFTVR